jgi:Flp pilus assembly protein TadD
MGIRVTYNPSASRRWRFSAVSKRRTTSLIISLVLSFAAVVPRAALGYRASGPAADPATETTAEAVAEATPAAPAEVETKTEAPADAAEAADAQEQKPKGNAFTRALSAPFRALARLFGGGGRRKSEAAKKPSAPAESKTQTQTTAQTTPVEVPKVEPVTAPAAPTNEPEAVNNVAATNADATNVTPTKTAATPSQEGVRIVRPSAGETAEALKPKMWIPLIVGVPSDPVSQGRALLQHGYIQEAIAELQIAASNVGPQLAEANNLLGLAYDRLGWHRQAAEAYGRALTVSPKDWVVLANLGYSLYLSDDYAGALKRLKQAAKLAPSEPVIHTNLGVVNARLGRLGDAYKNFAKASNEYEAHVKLAGILEEQRRDREAVKHYEAALRLQPGASAVLERLVALYDRTGDRDKADTARRALSQPKNPQRTATGGGG